MIATLLNQGWTIATLIIVIALSFAFALTKLKRSHGLKNSRLRAHKKLLSKKDQRIFTQLVEALEHEFHVFTKVSVLELIDLKPNNEGRESKAQFKMFASLIFDFVICRKSDFSVVAVIEMDRLARSNLRNKPSRESLLNKICDSMEVKLLQLDYGQSYENADLRRLVTGRATSLSNLESASSKIEHGSANHSIQSTRSVMTNYLNQASCPQCHSELVTRMAMKGEHIGERFLMCQKYPYCDYRIPQNQSRQDRARREGYKKDRHSKKTVDTVTTSEQIQRGYADWA